MKLSDLLELSALKFYFKYLHGSLPRFFYSFNIATQGTQHSHDTRQRDELRVDRSRINLADNKIRIFLPTLVNSTPLDLLHKITTHRIQGFSTLFNQEISRQLLQHKLLCVLILILVFYCYQYAGAFWRLLNDTEHVYLHQKR